jgi:hypothetical protein
MSALVAARSSILALLEIHHQVARSLDGPRAARVSGNSGQVHAARAVFDHDQRIDPSQGDRIDVQEVHGKDGGALLGQELRPAGT